MSKRNPSPHMLAVQRANCLLQTYADAVDRGDTQAMLALFAPDAVWTYSPDMLLRGVDEMTAYCRQGVRIYKRTSHHVSLPVLGPLAEDGSFDSLAYLVAVPELHDGRRYTVWGRSVDRLVNHGGRLLIGNRQVQAHRTDGTSRRYHPLPRMTPSG